MKYVIILMVFTLASCASTKIKKDTNDKEFILSICDNVFPLEIDTIIKIGEIETYRLSLNYDLGISLNVANAVADTIHSSNEYGEPYTFIDSASTKRVCLLNLINSIDDIFLKFEFENRESDSLNLCFQLISSQRRISNMCTGLNSSDLSIKKIKAETGEIRQGELLLLNALKYKNNNTYYLINLKGFIALLKN
jgi:hypothetical protein